jgi:integrase
MANIEKRCRHGRENWDSCGCSWYVRSQRNRKVTFTPAGRSRAEAERNLRRITGLNQETVGEALDIWLAMERLNPDARVGTIASHEGRAKIVRANLGHMPVRDVRPDDVAMFARKLMETGRAASTCRGICSVLMSALKHAAARGVIHQLPAPPQGLGIPMPSARRHDITIGELRTVIARMPRKWGLLAELCLLTGLRIGEAMALERGDVSDGILHVRRTRNRRGTVNGPKTSRSERLIPLDERAQEVFDALNLPFECSYTQARRVLDEALGPLKERGMGWHVFRHAHVTLLEQDGASLREVADRLGHGHNYTVTLGYTLKSQARPPRPLGEILKQHDPSVPSGASGQSVASLAEARQRRAARARRGGP